VAPSVTAHGFEWRDQEELQAIGGPVPRRIWSVRTLSGDIIAEGGDSVGYGRGRTPVDYFLAVFPQQQVSMIAKLTSARLSGRERTHSAGRSPEAVWSCTARYALRVWVSVGPVVHNSPH